jgi:di/tricarboxylate transporter
MPAMMTAPSLHALAVLALTLLMFWMFARTKVRVELVCLLIIAVLALGLYFFPIRAGESQVGLEIAFGGFGHEALIAICSLMIVGRGLSVTGALEPAARLLGRLWAFNAGVGTLCTLLICGALSMFVNDTPVVVLTMPILINLAARANIAASQTLMPANAAVLIGGMSTTIGTSTNLLVVSIAQDLGVPRFGVFQFTGIALTAALVALPYVWLIMPRLLPRNTMAAAEALRTFNASLHAMEGSKLVGVPFSKLGETVGAGIRVRAVMRGWGGVLSVLEDRDVLPEDRVLVTGPADRLREASQNLRAPLAHPTITERIRSFGRRDSEGNVTAEIVIGSQSPLIGESVASARIADRYGVVVIGTYRPVRAPFEPTPAAAIERLEVGDVLLVEGARAAVRDLELGESALMLEGAAELPRTEKAPLALLIAALVIAAAAFKIVPIAISGLAGTIAMVATGCIQFERIGRALSAEVIVLVASSIALGRALVETGAASWLGTLFAAGSSICRRA